MVWGRQNYGFDEDEVDLNDQKSPVKLQRISSLDQGFTPFSFHTSFNPDQGTELEKKTPGAGSEVSSEQKEAKSEEKNEEGEHEEEDEPSYKTTRWLIMEPSMILGFMIHVANYSLISQYLYYAIGEKYNLTAIMEEESRRNVTIDSGGTPGCGGIGIDKNSTAYTTQQRAQAETARFNLYIDIVTDVPGFIVILFFGRVMDQMGRKPMLLLPLIGLSLRGLLYIIQQQFKLPLEILLLSGLVESTTGGFSTFMTAAYAVIIDTLRKSERGRRLALVDVSLILFMAFMNFIMGQMIENLGFYWPFWVIVSCHLINIVYIFFFVPETGKKTGEGCKGISIKYVLDSFKVVLRKREDGQRPLLLIMVAAWLTTGFAIAAYSLDSLYKLNSPFCWSASKLGIFMAVSSLVPSVLQMIFAHFFLKKLNDISVIMFSLVFSAGAAIMTGLATTDLLLWLAPLVGAPGGLNHSLMRSAISKLLPPTEQGSVFAFMISMQKITGIAASTMYNNVYAATLFVFKGTIYMMMAGFTMLTFVLLIFYKLIEHRQLQNAAGDANSISDDVTKPTDNNQSQKQSY